MENFCEIKVVIKLSMRDKVTVQCPKCTRSIEVQQWSAVNGDKNPEKKKKLLDGTLFTAKCKNCGNTVQVGYPLLYNDPEQNIMIWLVYDDSEVKHVTDYFKSSKSATGDNKADMYCRQRIVRDSFRLREKLMIFDSGLDDKIVEIAKLAFSQSVQKQNPKEKIAAAFFSNEGGQNHVEIYSASGNAFTVALTDDIYKNLEDTYSGKASYAEDRVYIIDDVWALQLLREFNSEHR